MHWMSRKVLENVSYTKLNGVDLIWPVFSRGAADLNGKSIIPWELFSSLISWCFVTSWEESQGVGYQASKQQQKEAHKLFFVTHFDNGLHDDTNRIKTALGTTWKMRNRASKSNLVDVKRRAGVEGLGSILEK